MCTLSAPVRSRSSSTWPAELVRGGADVAGEEAVVHGVHGAEAAAAQRAAEHGEHRPVVHDPVHQQDRRPGCLHVGDEQAAPHRGQRVRPVPGGFGELLAEEPGRVDHQVRREPGPLDGETAEAGRGAERARDVGADSPDLGGSRARRRGHLGQAAQSGVDQRHVRR